MFQKWKQNLLARSENEIIVIEDSDSENDPSEVEIITTSNNEPINLSVNGGTSTEFPVLTFTSDYQDVLEEINKDLGISNSVIQTDTSMLETEIRIEDVFSIPALNLSPPDPQPTPDTPKQDYKHDYDKLVEENRNLMNSLKTILECPVCLTMVRSSPVPSCHNGHIVCTSCWNMTHLCPLCRVKLHETEKCFSQPANTLLQLVMLPCLYEDEGCSFQVGRDRLSLCSFQVGVVRLSLCSFQVGVDRLSFCSFQVGMDRLSLCSFQVGMDRLLL